MPELANERRLVVEYARKCREHGLIVGTSGNLSMAVDGGIAITPSGIDYSVMQPRGVSIIDAEGTVLEGELLPSSEWRLHLGIYDTSEAGAVVHTHSPYATAVSSVVDVLPPLHYHVAHMGGPIPVAPYATFGSRELAENVCRTLEGRSAALMQNHGAVAIGSSLEVAFRRAETLEWLAQVYCISTAIGSPRLLSTGELENVVQARTLLRERQESMPDWQG